MEGIIKLFAILIIVGALTTTGSVLIVFHKWIFVSHIIEPIKYVVTHHQGYKTALIQVSKGVISLVVMLFIELGLLRLIFPSYFKAIFNAYKNAIFYPFRATFRFLMSKLKFKKINTTLPKGISVPIKIQEPRVVTLQTEKQKIFIPNVFRGVLVVGGAGSGKTESFAIPLIREFSKQNFTGIVYDFKFPILAQEVSDYYTAENSQTKRYFLNFSNALHSHRINPLNPRYMPFSAYAREYASAIIKNLMKESIRKEDFWSRSATDLLTAVIWYLKKHYPNYCDLPHVLALLQQNHTELIKLLIQDNEIRAMIVSIATAVESGAGEQIAGVVGSLQGAVAQINTPEFMWIFGGDDFSLELNSLDNPGVVIVGSNPTISTTIAPLCSLVISVASKMMNQPDKRPSFIMLDESPTVFIPNIEVIPNTGRSNKMATVLFIQDLSQLVESYGKEKADVLFSSCGTHFYGRVATSHTADILSKQFGKEDKTFETRSVSTTTNPFKFNGNKGRSTSIQERDVVKSNDFMNLRTGEFVGRVAEVEERMIFERFQMSKCNTKTDLTAIIPSYKSIQIMNFYNEVAERVKRILKGEENFYNESVERNHLIKRDLIENETKEEEAGATEEPTEEPGGNSNLHLDEELLKLQELTSKMFRTKD